MYIRRILLIIVFIGLIVGGFFAYKIYAAIFSPNTAFNNDEAYVYVATDATYEDLKATLDPLLDDVDSFKQVAERKGYLANIKGGKYAIKKGMNNNEIINSLRSNNIPVKVAFNNQETLADLAGRISGQLEPDSLSLLTSFNDSDFLKTNGFDEHTRLSMYIPNSYEFFWNTSALEFRERMLTEYKRFWNTDRMERRRH